MTDELQHNQTIHDLHHEIQNCLNVISMGVDVLRDSRDDDAMFAEFHESIQEQRRIAARQLNEFLKTACQGCESLDGHIARRQQ